MKRIGDLILVLTAAGVFWSGVAGAEERLQNWAENKDLGKKIVLLGVGPVNKLKENGIASPKKVGLISFYLWDSGTFEFNAMAHQYGGVYQETAGLTPKGANHFATKLAEAGIPALKNAFAAQGMELLLPVEFAKTDQQRQAYVNFALPMGKLGGAALNIAQWIQKTPKASSAATGFNGIHTHLWQDATMLTALEELRQQLGLDVIAVLANTSVSDKKGVMLTGVEFYMYGHNPVPKPSQKIAQFAWSPGMPYAKAQFGKGFKGVQIAKIKKGEVEAEDYEGYDKIAAALATEALKEFGKKYE